MIVLRLNDRQFAAILGALRHASAELARVDGHNLGAPVATFTDAAVVYTDCNKYPPPGPSYLTALADRLNTQRARHRTRASGPQRGAL